jgi:hypothetical protein
MVVSDRSAVAGNSPAPGGDPGDRANHETVAFVGQVPTKVRGRVESGDLVVPSGDADGTARAVEPDGLTPGEAPLVGRAWETDPGEGVSEVTVAVGVDDPTLVGERVADNRERIRALEAENDRLRRENERLCDRVDEIEAHVGRQSGNFTPGVAGSSRS